jgi:nucleoside phosphorylase
MLDQRIYTGQAIILTALESEYMAVRAHLNNLREEIYKGTIYERGNFSASQWQWDVGVVQIGSGNTSAGIEAERAITYFNPQVTFFVGVAGGIKDVKIGDVVAATKVYGYESGKVQNATFYVRPDVGESSHRLVQRARAEARKGNWRRRIIGGFPTSEVAPDVLIGAIAAGEKVIADNRSDTFSFLKTHYNDTLVVEMEGRGFLNAAHSNETVQALVIRGVSDLLQNKEIAEASGSQQLASRHASAFAFEILAQLDTSFTQQHTISYASNAQSSKDSQVLPHAQKNAQPFEIFFSYAREDEKLVKRLQDQLSILKRQQIITDWHAGKIVPGQEPTAEIIKHLHSAHIVLLIISPAFTASEQHAIETMLAMERHAHKEAIVIPIMLRPTATWSDESFSKLQALPRGGKAITEWVNLDLAFAQVAKEIANVVENLPINLDSI